MRNNNQTNELIKWSVIFLDFVVMNLLVWLFAKYHPTMIEWTSDKKNIFFLVTNLALVISEYRFFTVIHRRRTTSTDILMRIMGLTMLHVVVAYLFLKIMDYSLPVGMVLFQLDTLMFVSLYSAIWRLY